MFRLLFWPARVAIKLVSLFVAAVLVYLIICGVQVLTASRVTSSRNGVKPAMAIAVAGGCRSSQLSADIHSRLVWAASLYAARRGPDVTVCGNSGSALVASEIRTLERAGVTGSRINLVSASSVTNELSGIARRLGRGKRVLIVTDAIDVLWTEGVASSDGLQPEVSSPPASKKFVTSELTALWREATGVAVGRVVGFARAGWAGN
jgi:hypothetical protein